MNQPAASASSLEAQIRACCQTLDDKKAEHLKVLHLGDRSSLTEYFIIATGTSQPHLRAIRVAIEDTLQKLNSSVIGVDSDPNSGWVVVDAGDFMVHVFTRDVRDVYRLDVLWRDADDVTQAMIVPEIKVTTGPVVTEKPVKAAKAPRATKKTAEKAEKADEPVKAKIPKATSTVKKASAPKKPRAKKAPEAPAAE